MAGEVRKNSFGGLITYNTRLDLVQKVLRCYNGFLSAMGKEEISERHLYLLACYILYGCSDETALKYMDLQGIGRKYLNVLKTEIKKAGYIICANKRTKEYRLDSNLESIRQFFVLSEENESQSVFNIIFREER